MLTDSFGLFCRLISHRAYSISAVLIINRSISVWKINTHNKDVLWDCPCYSCRMFVSVLSAKSCCSVDPIQQKSIDYDLIIIPDTVTSPTIPALSFVHVQLARESRLPNSRASCTRNFQHKL